jgi:hypothetical protein
MSLDLEFNIQRDDDDDCSLCLSSTALDLSCVEGEITGGDKMSVPWSNPASADGPSCCCLDGSWSLDLTSVTGSDGCTAATITTGPAAFVSPDWGNCSDCFEDCSCICCHLCLCIRVYDDLDVDRCLECRECVKATYDPTIGSYGGWTASIACGDEDTEVVTLELTSDCKIAVTTTNYTVADQTATCPNLGFTVVLDDSLDRTVELEVSCAACGEDCDSVDPPGTCNCCAPMDDIRCVNPEFTATISSACAALNATATLSAGSGGECVEFRVDAEPDFCDVDLEPGCDDCALAGWSLVLDCDSDACDTTEPCFNSWIELEWANACCPEMTPGRLFPTSCSCSPLQLVYDVPSFTNPCCSCSSETCSVTITITEA